MIKVSTATMFERLRLFKNLGLVERGYICYISIYNNLRLFEDNAENRQRLVADIVSRTYDSPSLLLKSTSWHKSLDDFHRLLRKVPGTKPFERSLILGRELARAGFCPFIQYAFDGWHDLGDFDAPADRRATLNRLAELSTTYLYRLVEVPFSVNDPIIGQGGYSNVVLVDENFVDKIPINFAATSFASHDEYLLSMYIATSPLSNYVPRLIDYEQTTGIIRREYIHGKSGSELLKDPAFAVCPFGLDQIHEIYCLANEIYDKSGINLDIHPSNFLWDDKNSRWFFVDLGPMPSIGADYFPRKNFEEYMKKIWFDRLRLMITVPIRSVEIGASIDSVPPDFFMTFLGTKPS